MWTEYQILKEGWSQLRTNFCSLRLRCLDQLIIPSQSLTLRRGWHMAGMCSRCWGKNVLPAFLPLRPLASPKYLSSKEVKMSPPPQPPHLSELSGILPPTWTGTRSCRPGCRLGKSEVNLSWVCSIVEPEEQAFLLSLWKERIVGLSL